MKDKQFLEDADKQRLVVEPMTGAKVQEMVAKLYQTPPDIVARAKEAIKP